MGGSAKFPRDSSKAVETIDLELFRKLGARYLYVEPASADESQRQRIASLSASGELRQVWASSESHSAIFRSRGSEFFGGVRAFDPSCSK